MAVATTTRTANASVEERRDLASAAEGEGEIERALSRRSHEFSFFQAMRLVHLLAQKGGQPGKVRVVPELDLAFPPADVAAIEKRGEEYRLKVRFLGLYGESSPLPTFYTEQLMEEESAEMSAARDLLDIINHHLYTLFHDCVTKYRLHFQLAEQEREEYPERLFCLIGLGHEKFRRHLPDPRRLLRHIGLFTQFPRSALGLRTLIADALKVPVKVIQCLKRNVPVPPDQQLLVGVSNASLGVDTVIGSEAGDRAGKFRLQLGPLDLDTFYAYLPGTPGRLWLDTLVSYYLSVPLMWDVELILKSTETPAATLGLETGGRLGCDTWLAPDRRGDASLVSS